MTFCVEGAPAITKEERAEVEKALCVQMNRLAQGIFYYISVLIYRILEF